LHRINRSRQAPHFVGHVRPLLSKTQKFCTNDLVASIPGAAETFIGPPYRINGP
jgi:hypothetical protein